MIRISNEDTLKETLDVPHTVYMEDHFIKINFPNINFPIISAFYGAKLDYNVFKFKFPGDYYLVASSGELYLEDETSIPVVPNTILIDSDYNHPILLGCFIPNQPRNVNRIELTCSVFGYSLTKNEEEIDFFSRTQSPVFNSAPFPFASYFYGLYRSSEGANGYDVVINNCELGFIYSGGNLVLDMRDSFRSSSTGCVVLRSRFVRMGLELHVHNDYFHLTNHSSNPVEIKRRMFQYVPMRTFNGKVCSSNGVISTNCSIKTQKRYQEKDLLFGQITRANNVKKSKC